MMTGDFSMWTKRLSRFASHRSIDRLLGFPSLHRRRPGFPPFVRPFVRSFVLSTHPWASVRKSTHRVVGRYGSSQPVILPCKRSFVYGTRRSRGSPRGRVRTNGRTDGPTDRDATIRVPRRSHPSFDHRSRSRSRSLFDHTRRRGFFRGYAQNLGRKKA